jgi:hypothetical protein
MTDDPTTATRRRRFSRGLHSRNPLVLVLAGVLVIPALYGLQALFSSGAFTVVPESDLLRTSRDDFFHNTYVVGSLKRHPPTRLPIYIIGGSAARESLISESSFAQAVHRASGVPVQTYVLSNYDQTFGQSLAIVDNLPPGKGIVVLAVNNNRFHFGPSDIARQTQGLPLLLESPTLSHFVANDPASSGISKRLSRLLLPGALPGIMDYLLGYIDSRASALTSASPLGLAYRPHWITQRTRWSRARKEQGVQAWIKSRGAAFFKNYAYDARLLDTLVARAEQRGFKVVLLEETEDTAVVGHSFDAFKRIYKPIVRRIAAKYGAPYLDLQPQLNLPDSAFWDYIHPAEPARVAWQKVLAAALKPIVQQARAASGAAALRLADAAALR